MNPFSRYLRWLHTQWPAGHVEKLPLTNEDGSTNVPGLFVVGDLRGVPLLKFSADSGARAVKTIVADAAFQSERKSGGDGVLDLAIVGAGVGGMSAALEARAAGLDFRVFEAAEAFSTIVNFPKGKPIYTYPKEMTPEGSLSITSEIKEDLVAELRRQTVDAGIELTPARVESVRRQGKAFEVVVPKGESLRARRVVVAVGRSGNFRKLGVPGENLDKVYNRLHDPKDFCGQRALIVGGGDSAMETAIALALCGGQVTISYRKKEFSRPKPENVEQLERLAADPMAEDVAVEEPSSERVTTSAGAYLAEHRRAGSIRTFMESGVTEIREGEVALKTAGGGEETIPNDVVFTMIGREPPLDFFRRSGVAIAGELSGNSKVTLGLFLLFCVLLYHWKSGGIVTAWFEAQHLFPFGIGEGADPATLLGTLSISAGKPGFWYAFAYTACIVGFGIRRIRRRQTPYVTTQTVTLMAIQALPLFLFPYLVLPWAGHLGAFDGGALGSLADQLFPVTEWDPHGREYWRAFGFILAWPLFLWNFFTDQPMGLWLLIGGLQTFVIIPLLVRRWGKGAYCGWICSCGALAETMGDAHRHKMPHGPKWNRVNAVGQVILGLAVGLLVLRVVGWALPSDHPVNASYMGLLQGKTSSWGDLPFPLSVFNYKYVVDLWLAGVIGVAFYFHYSGRVWCRFACPLAALMHIYARFSRFRILPEKKKCISCNVCTSVCHQGIDVMNFANKGMPMADPECVRCSACVQSCPTGVLTFGRVDGDGNPVAKDRLAASPVQMREAG